MSTTRFASVLAIVAALLVLAGGSPAYAGPKALKCAFAKQMAAVQEADALLGCQRKAERNNTTVNPACTAAAIAALRRRVPAGRGERWLQTGGRRGPDPAVRRPLRDENRPAASGTLRGERVDLRHGRSALLHRSDVQGQDRAVAGLRLGTRLATAIGEDSLARHSFPTTPRPPRARRARGSARRRVVLLRRPLLVTRRRHDPHRSRRDRLRVRLPAGRHRAHPADLRAGGRRQSSVRAAGAQQRDQPHGGRTEQRHAVRDRGARPALGSAALDGARHHRPLQYLPAARRLDGVLRLPGHAGDRRPGRHLGAGPAGLRRRAAGRRRADRRADAAGVPARPRAGPRRHRRAERDGAHRAGRDPPARSRGAGDAAARRARGSTRRQRQQRTRLLGRARRRAGDRCADHRRAARAGRASRRARRRSGTPSVERGRRSGDPGGARGRQRARPAADRAGNRRDRHRRMAGASAPTSAPTATIWSRAPPSRATAGARTSPPRRSIRAPSTTRAAPRSTAAAATASTSRPARCRRCARSGP